MTRSRNLLVSGHAISVPIRDHFRVMLLLDHPDARTDFASELRDRALGLPAPDASAPVAPVIVSPEAAVVRG
jgi:hypothetical protein